MNSIINQIIPNKLLNQNNNQFLSNKLKRRSKKDKVGRNYICGCQKRYLSYPALYTHIKTKHNGQLQEGTKDLNTNQKTKRGRPKKVDFLNQNNTNEIVIQSIKQLNLFKNEQEKEDEEDHQLQERGVLFLWLKEQVVCKDDLKGSYKGLGKMEIWGETNPFKYFSDLDFTSQNKQEVKRMESYLNRFDQEEDNSWFEEHKNKPYFLFSLFLHNLSKIVTQQVYTLFAILLRYFLQCLNHYGYQLININHKDNNSNSTPFADQDHATLMPILADYFLTTYLPYHQPNFDQFIAYLILNDILKWLVKIKVTKFSVAFRSNIMNTSINLNNNIKNQYFKLN